MKRIIDWEKTVEEPFKSSGRWCLPLKLTAEDGETCGYWLQAQRKKDLIEKFQSRKMLNELFIDGDYVTWKPSFNDLKEVAL